MYIKYFKRIFDFILAIFLTILFLPLFIVIWLAIKIEEPHAPAIFKQVRCGKDKKPFILYKFRSMSSQAPSNLSTREFIDVQKYISPLGYLIRVSSLDEIPQLFNIIKGDMSFVGPRPVIYEERRLIAERERLGVLELLPGITGYAQVNGRDEVDIDRKVLYDEKYCKEISFKEDLKIFLLTVPTVIIRKGHKENKKRRIYKDNYEE
ncbi:sugar transferase [Gallicola sp. Sow4_E12]|uniref:sugar transferase n=1 Tax=Gallicola sp. Sow4_E12 TaxID=3438785 RepID=UPI003F8E9781